MARKNMSVARVEKLSASNVGKSERHNERKNESYSNLNVVPERIPFNVSFKSTDGLTYNEYFQKLLDKGKISTRGLKDGATLFDEMVIDVNTEYFEERGGYEYAKKFYEEAYHFSCGIYGEDNIVSAVMHADEINTEVSERLGKPVYHYHLHVVAIPVVDKEIRWTKRCKDPALVGTVKEVIHQVSHSKKWKNTVPVLDKEGKQVVSKAGKPVFVKSYSILQDQLFEHMTKAGFRDFERGERGSTTEHLSSLDFQIQKESERLKDYEMSTWATQEKLYGVQEELSETESKQSRTENQLFDVEAKLSKTKIAYKRSLTETKMDHEIDSMGKKGFTGKYSVEEKDFRDLTSLAKEAIASRGEIGRLNDALESSNRSVRALRGQVNRLQTALDDLTQKYEKLVELTRPFLVALQQFPEKVREFFDRLFPPKIKEQEQETKQPVMKPKHKSRDDEAR